jgi:hypothetical protein
MRIEWNMPITMDDSLVLRADVFRPIPDGSSGDSDCGPYAKGLAFQDGYRTSGSAWSPSTGRGGGLDQQIPELGSRRSGEVGAR